MTLPLGGVIDPVMSRRLTRRMAVRGHAVQLERMGSDRLDVFECLALAQACADDALRADALHLFSAFERAAQL